MREAQGTSKGKRRHHLGVAPGLRDEEEKHFAESTDPYTSVLELKGGGLAKLANELVRAEGGQPALRNRSGVNSLPALLRKQPKVAFLETLLCREPMLVLLPLRRSCCRGVAASLWDSCLDNNGDCWATMRGTPS